MKVFISRVLSGYERLFWGYLDKHTVFVERESGKGGGYDHLSVLDFNTAVQQLYRANCIINETFEKCTFILY